MTNIVDYKQVILTLTTQNVKTLIEQDVSFEMAVTEMATVRHCSISEATDCLLWAEDLAQMKLRR